MDSAKMAMYDLIDKWKDQKLIYNFEGDSGLTRFEKFLNALGYDEHGYKHGTPIESFLSDNPGAVDALLEWIAENYDQHWIENLQNEIIQCQYTIRMRKAEILIVPSKLREEAFDSEDAACEWLEKQIADGVLFGDVNDYTFEEVAAEDD